MVASAEAELHADILHHLRMDHGHTTANEMQRCRTCSRRAESITEMVSKTLADQNELIIELLARREATDQLLGDFFGHPRYQSMTYPEAAVRATAFNIYEDALDVGYGRDIEQRIIDFADEHDADVTARSRALFQEARAWHPELKNSNERG